MERMIDAIIAIILQIEKFHLWIKNSDFGSSYLRSNSEVSRHIKTGMKVVWWGRRATFEIVEEVSEAIFRAWIAISAGHMIWPESIFGLDVSPLGWWITVAIICLLLSNHAIIEIGQWRNEIYIVVKDENIGGGRVYKFTGWIGKRHIDEAITPASPTLTFDQPWYFRAWGWLTGEKMSRITLKSANHTFLDSQKISPRFEDAIVSVRGHAPKNQDVEPSDLASLEEIKQAWENGLIDKRRAKQVAEAIIARAVYDV